MICGAAVKPLFSSRSCFVLALVAMLGGCGDDDRNVNAPTTTSNVGGSGASGAGGDGSGGTTGPAGNMQTVAGDITWTVTFDATARNAGSTDCTYTRHYQGVQDDSAPWLCPACEVMFRADVEMTAGEDDCFSQVSEFQPAPVEWLGWSNGALWRGAGGPMSEQGTVVVDGGSIATANAVADLDTMNGGKLAFDVAGQLSLEAIDGDPMHGFHPPSSYACGWPKADPPNYTGDYLLQVGATLPDGLFKDACDETVRLHDLADDSYLLVDMSAYDCPPCQQMAAGEQDFIASMADQGIAVEVVTLMAPSLAKPLDETPTATLVAWADAYGLTAPVLGDRAWGLSMFLPALGDGLGYPSWVLVAPDLTVISFGSGFSGFAAHEAALLNHGGQ